MKKILLIKIAIITSIILFAVAIVIGIISAVTGVAIGYEKMQRQTLELKTSKGVLNNQLYAERYRILLNKYLKDKGYVTLERLVFYLQRTNNVLDITTLDDEIWESAYLANVNQENKQMIPIKTICKNLKSDNSIPEFTIENGTNDSGILIEVLDLCTVNGEDITNSNSYLEGYFSLPYNFPLKDNFTVTSIVFENRTVDFSNSEQMNLNFHSGWDFAVPTGTRFYSVCSGTINKIVNTQFNDLSYENSQNAIGNYLEVECDDGNTVSYHHIKANSVPGMYKEGIYINRGIPLGLTSTTGLSSGPHLHLELKNRDGNLLDTLSYIDFNGN